MHQIRKIAFVLILVFLSLAQLSAQSFFTSRVAGTFQVTFTSSVPGIALLIDDAPAGILPVTLFVKAGPRKFTWIEPGTSGKSITYPISSDTEVPYMMTASRYPLTISVNVPNATLYIDNQIVSPSTEVTPGKHTLRVSAPGYVESVIPFTQPSNANNLTVNLIMQAYPFTVNVPGVRNPTIFINGAKANPTSSLTPGTYTIKVVAPGFADFETTFTMPSQGYTLPVALAAATYPFSVSVNVPNAYLEVDGKPIGNTASLPAGSHTLKVSAPGYQDAILPFTQPPNSMTLKVNLNLIPATVNIVLDRFLKGRGNERSVKVFVNGAEKRGTSIQVEPGTFNLRIEANGVTAEGTFTVQAGQSITVSPRVVLEQQ